MDALEAKHVRELEELQAQMGELKACQVGGRHTILHIVGEVVCVGHVCLSKQDCIG